MTLCLVAQCLKSCMAKKNRTPGHDTHICWLNITFQVLVLHLSHMKAANPIISNRCLLCANTRQNNYRNVLPSTLFRTHELTDTNDCLMVLWLTGEREYTPPSQKAWLILNFWVRAMAGCCMVGIQTRDLPKNCSILPQISNPCLKGQLVDPFLVSGSIPWSRNEPLLQRPDASE